MLKYKDQENKNSVLEDLKNCSTHKEVIDLINRTFPTWIVDCCDKYCNDYPHLNKNWQSVCDKIGVPKLNILLVDFIEFKSAEYELISSFCELLTRFGHSVRRKDEFVICSLCKKCCIPTEEIYNDMKSKSIGTIPYSWTSLCRNC